MITEAVAVLQSDILESYYANNARKLHRTVDKILSKFGGLSNKDKDDFYSLANEVFVHVLKKYDDSQSFDGFLYSCLLNNIKTDITKRNRMKRKADRMAVSLDALIGDDEGCNLLELIPSDFDTFEETTGRQGSGQYQEKIQRYISRLSSQQVNILNLLVDGYKPHEIREILKISQKEYTDNLQIMRSYENVKILFQEETS